MVPNCLVLKLKILWHSIQLPSPHPLPDNESFCLLYLHTYIYNTTLVFHPTFTTSPYISLRRMLHASKMSFPYGLLYQPDSTADLFPKSVAIAFQSMNRIQFLCSLIPTFLCLFLLISYAFSIQVSPWKGQNKPPNRLDKQTFSFSFYKKKC